MTRINSPELFEAKKAGLTETQFVVKFYDEPDVILLSLYSKYECEHEWFMDSVNNASDLRSSKIEYIDRV